VVTLSGIVISLKLVHSSNAKSPMVVVLLGITTDVIPKRAKVDWPISVIVSGVVIDV